MVMLEEIAEIHQNTEEKRTKHPEQPDVVLELIEQSVKKLRETMWQWVNVNADLR